MLVESKTPLRTVELDVLGEANAAAYWGRDERHDTVLDLTFGRARTRCVGARSRGVGRAHAGPARAIQPVARIRDERWVWHVGLDAQANTIMNDLYNGKSKSSEDGSPASSPCSAWSSPIRR